MLSTNHGSAQMYIAIPQGAHRNSTIAFAEGTAQRIRLRRRMKQNV